MGLAHSPEAQVIQLDLPAAYPYLSLIGDSVATMMQRGDDIFERQMQTYTLQLAAHEACSMIIGRAYLPGEEGRIKVLLSMTQYPLPPCMMIEIQDTGRSLNFDLEHEPAPEDEPDSSWLLCTRLSLIHKLTNSISYRAVGRTNSLRMVKVLA